VIWRPTDASSVARIYTEIPAPVREALVLTTAANETDPQGANNSDTESTLVLSPSAVIPTLATWGLLALVVLLAGAGSRLLRRT
jgi:hypothetical protein